MTRIYKWLIKKHTNGPSPHVSEPASTAGKHPGWRASADVIEAYDRAMDAAISLDKVDDAKGQIRQIIESSESASALFVQQSLHERVRAHFS